MYKKYINYVNIGDVISQYGDIVKGRLVTLSDIQIVMSFKIFILILPAAICSEIVINVQGGHDPRVEVSGSEINIISDAERETFHIHDNDLKNAIEKYNEARPNDVFVRGPTPWGDLYKTFGWKQVERTLVTKGAKVVYNQVQETVVASKKIHNNSPNAVNVTVDICQIEDNIIGHYWTRIGYVTPSDRIVYNIKAGVNGAVSLTVKNAFMEDTVNILPTKLASEATGSITLQADQTGVAVLIATKGNMNVEVDFEASLQGYVAMNYANIHKGHFFWGIDINTLLEASGKPRTLSWKETMNVVYYVDERVLVYDLNGIGLN